MNILVVVLKSLRVQFTEDYLKKAFLTHPDRSTLLSYVRVLALYGVSTKTVKLSGVNALQKEYLPCISTYQERFVIIKGLQANSITFTTNGLNNICVDRQQFVLSWNQVVTLFSKTSYTGEPFYEQNRTKSQRRLIQRLGVFFLILLLLVVHPPMLTIGWCINAVGAGLGLFLSVFLFEQSYAHQENIYYKCTPTKYFDCNLNHKKRGKIDLSDMGVIYFTTALTVLCLVDSWQYVLPIYYALGLLFSLWALYLQVRVYKKYCILCSLIQLDVLCLVGYNIAIASNIVLEIQVQTLGLVSLILLFWGMAVKIFYRPLNEYRKEHLNCLSKLNLFKLKLLSEVMAENNPILRAWVDFVPKEIVIGEKQSTNFLTIVLNPFCHSCRQEYIEAYSALNTTTSIQTNIILTCIDEEQIKFAEYIFSYSSSSLPASHLLYTWLSRKGEQTISNTTPSNEASYVQTVIASHQKWLYKNNITETPTYFLNGKRLPNGITILDTLNYI